jgi:hypothetical protein
MVSKEKADLLVKYKDLITEYDLSASYEANFGAFAKEEIPSFMADVLTDLGFEKGLESSRLGARLGQYFDAELKSEWAALSAESGAPPLTLSDRRQKMHEIVENVKDRFLDTLQNNPEKFKLSPTLSTSLKNKQAEKSGSMGTGELQAARGTVSSVTDVSRSISTDTPSKSVIRGSSVPWFGDKNTVTPVFESESALFDTASRASKTYRSIILATENGSFTPEMQQQHNIDKAAMNVEAERYISDFTSTTIRTVSPYSPWRPEGWANGRWRSLPNDRDVPLFIFRDDGVYVAVRGFSAVEPTRSGDIVDNKVVYTPQTDLNARYWAAKAVTGYSKDEVTSGRTAEGVRITPAQLDPREFLLFKSSEEFSTALAEYTSTSGKSGFIAELLPRTGVTYEVFRATQLKLLGMRKPLESPTKSTDPSDYRPDGSPKGSGWLGPRKTKSGANVTEYSVGVDINGQQLDIPTMIPELSEEEINKILIAAEKGEFPDQAIIAKAIAHAQKMISEGKSVFAPETKNSGR